MATAADSSESLPELPAPRTGAAAWRPRVSVVMAWAVLIAVLMSAQLLFQPFVWRNWPWDEVLSAWLDAAAERIAVALVIALLLCGAWLVPLRSLRQRAMLLAMAVAFGATAAEKTMALLTGDTSEHLSWARLASWSVVAASVAAMFYLWRHGVEVRDAAQAVELRRAQMERQIVQTRLQALRSQIEPHFLFNTLATVRSLQHADPAQGEQLLMHLLAYLRATLPGLSADHATLGQELDLVRAYLGVVSLRMSGRLEVRIDVPDALRGCAFPALSIATLVENAVKHGLGPLPAGGLLHLSARREGDSVEVCVADTGVGFGSGGGGSGIGLANVRARLQTLYGSAGALSLQANRPTGVRASIRLPFLPGGAAT